MDRRIGGRPPTRTSAARHASLSPSSRSSYRSYSRSRSPSPDISSDSARYSARRRLSTSPLRLRSAQEEAYFAIQAAREERLANSILADDSPYVPPSAREPLPPQRAQQATQRPDWQGRDSNRQHVASTPSAREYQHPVAARGDRGRGVRRDDSRRMVGSDGSSSESDDNHLGGTDAQRQIAASSAGRERPERRHSIGVNTSRRRNRDEDVILADDEPYNAPPATASAFNRERYPAYDQNARRIGLDHIRYTKPSLRANQNDNVPPHYLPRTQSYPTGADNGEQAMSVDSPGSQPRRAIRTPPPLAPDPADEIDQLAGETDRHGTGNDAHGPGRRRSPRRAAPLADAADIPDSTPHVRELLGLRPDQEVGLHALADPPPGEKPTYPYPLLIQLAILGSPKKRLTLAEIYSAIEDRFDWFKKTSDKAWQGSIRHTLSLKSIFRSVSRPITEPGKGNYWMVDHRQGDGNKRARKRNPRPKKVERSIAKPHVEVMRREEEETTPTDDDYDSDLMPMEDPNIDPQLRGHGYMGPRGYPRGSNAFTFNSQAGQNGHGRAIAVPFTPSVINSAGLMARANQPAFGQPSLGMNNRSTSTYQSPFGQLTSVNQATFGQSSFGQPQGSNQSRYSPASSAPSPPLSTISSTSRQSSVFSAGSPQAFASSAANHRGPPSRQTIPRAGNERGHNPFGLRHVGPTQRAWHKSAGRMDDTSSGGSDYSDL